MLSQLDTIATFVAHFVKPYPLIAIMLVVFTRLEIHFHILDVITEVSSLMERVDKMWSCLACQYQSNRKTNLFEHVEAKHIQSTGYNCQDCGTFCKTYSAYRSHVKRLHPKAQAINWYLDDLELVLMSLVVHNGDCWSCNQCGKTAKTKQHIKAHAETHVPGLSHVCVYCNKTFKTSNTLQNHISLTHNKYKS